MLSPCDMPRRPPGTLRKGVGCWPWREFTTSARARIGGSGCRLFGTDFWLQCGWPRGADRQQSARQPLQAERRAAAGPSADAPSREAAVSSCSASRLGWAIAYPNGSSRRMRQADGACRIQVRHCHPSGCGLLGCSRGRPRSGQAREAWWPASVAGDSILSSSRNRGNPGAPLGLYVWSIKTFWCLLRRARHAHGEQQQSAEGK